jgi:PfaB family protein
LKSPHKIAIVGIGGIFPGAKNLEQFWDNILASKDCSREPPKDRWLLSLEDVYAPEPALDKVYSKRACFVDDFDFNPDNYDIDKKFIESLDPMFHLLLHAGQQAWRDAITDNLDKQRVGVIVGNIALPTDASSTLADEVLGSKFEEQLLGQPVKSFSSGTNRINRYVAGLPAGILARTLQLGGGSYTLDAACASSLYSLKYAVDELQSGRTDAMLCGGLSRPDSLYTQMGFSALHAISPSGHCSPFDNKADGLVVGEGSGIVLLKRLDDAIQDGDHIYATITGIGLSNDVEGSLMSPDSEGQLRAMRSAYQKAGWQPGDVDLIECHGTGTPVGDAIEFQSLKSLWGEDKKNDKDCVIGSVKSNVGHLLTAAGSAGLIKVLMALKHKTLPPTANFESSSIDLQDSPFTVLKQAQHWEQRASDQPRRAAVSAFGFGGINAHVLLEEYINHVKSSSDNVILLKSKTEKNSPAIAIVGLDAYFGPWDSLTKFQYRVLGSEENIVPVAPENWWGVENKNNIRGYFIDKVDIPFGRFRIPPTELKDMLPQQLLMLQVAANAIDDAKLNKEDNTAWLHTGVYIGIGLDLNTTNYHVRWSLLNKARQWNKELGLILTNGQLDEWISDLRDAVGPPLSANRTMGALGGIVASRVARAFNIGGPSLTLSSEESSGLRSLEAGVRALQRRELDTAIVGAVDLAGDVRSVIGQHDAHPDFSGDIIIGEGATALVLKRYDDAIRDGDRIYATINGIGSATGGDAEKTIPTDVAYKAAIQKTCDDAGIQLNEISYIETNGGGFTDEENMQAKALADLFQQCRRGIPCAIGSARADIGHTGAAGGLASVAKIALSLYHEVIPPLRDSQQWQPLFDKSQDEIFAPSATQYWLRNKAEGPRRALVSSFSVDGNCVNAILEGVESSSDQSALPVHPLGSDREALFSIEAKTAEELLQKIEKCNACINESSLTDIHVLARKWWQAKNTTGKEMLSLNILASNLKQMNNFLVEAKQYVEQNKAISSDNIFYSPDPLGRKGKVAFVFPGSGNHFIGMGQDVGCRWPEVLSRLDQENNHLASQFANGRFWNPDNSAELDHKDVIFGQVWLGTMMSDVTTNFGIKPNAIIGYSLGETAGLFATRTWIDRDKMLQRMQETSLFTQDLAGPCESVRKAWHLSADETVDWQIGVIDRSADVVRNALKDRSRVYLLIINTPHECVIGGDRDEVQTFIHDLDCNFHPVEGVTTVHCEVAKPVQEAYRNLHLFKTNPPGDLTFYSGVLGRSYEVTRDSAADSITNQALEPFDYTRVINAAYDDGIRIYIEMGPGVSCSRMINWILGDRSHIARSVCIKGLNGVTNFLRVMAQLNAERVPMDLDSLYRGDPAVNEKHTDQSMISVPVGGKAFNIPAPPANEQYQNVTTAEVINHPAVAKNPLTELIEQTGATEAAKAQTQETFLRVSNGLTETLAQALSMQMSLLQSTLQVTQIDFQNIKPFPLSVNNPPNNNAPILKTVAYDRDMCMEFAIGSIAKMLGPQFAEIDSHSTRVRLPDEPLMLVDRIIEVKGEPCSITSGRVITEHDIHDNAWYLDGGRIPTCIAVEAGQADLFLSGYLGIDLKTKGLAVYRLLDAEITFHDALTQPGQTIHYDIHIDHFFKQGETYLFRFNFTGTVNGEPLLTMKNGCAGFFTQAELDAGQGIVQTEMEKRPIDGVRNEDWVELTVMKMESYNDDQINTLRQGNLAACFGEAFLKLKLNDPVGLPTGRMTLVHRVLVLDPDGGRYGLGKIIGEADIHPDDWFLTCHFVDDQVMPGTLMYECCLHTLRIYLLRMGWVGEQDEFVYEPVYGIKSQLKCRGQVIGSTRRVQYEITLKEIGYQNDGVPYVLADALMYADGKPIVQMNNMSLQLSGMTKDRIESLWNVQYKTATEKIEDTKEAIFDHDSILAFAVGKPSDAFGEKYQIFDHERVIARLPGPPYQFLDRITSIEKCEQWQLRAGGVIEAHYDVPEDAWYFAADRQACVPFSVLLEVALQPCPVHGYNARYRDTHNQSKDHQCLYIRWHDYPEL